MSEVIVKPRRGTRRRQLLMGFIVAALVVLFARTGLDLWAGRRLDHEISKLEHAYGSLDVQTLIPPPVPPDANLARAVRAAAALINYAPLTRWSDFQSAYATFLKQPAPAAMPADLQAFVENNRTAVRVVGDARSRTESNWEADYATHVNVPQFLDIRTLSYAIYLTTRLDLDAGRADDAARSIAAGLLVCESLRQEPNVIAQLIRMAVGFQHFESVQRLLEGSEPSPASLEMLAGALARNRLPDPMHVGLLSELKFFNDAMARGEWGEIIPGARLARLGGVWFARPFARLARLRLLENIDHLLELQTGPRPRPRAADNAPPRWAVFRRFADGAASGLERAMLSADLFNSERSLTELAVALRRFRLEHGNYPDAVSELVPAYVPSVAIDPFTGRPPVYERQGDGFRLQGENGSPLQDMTVSALEWHVSK